MLFFPFVFCCLAWVHSGVGGIAAIILAERAKSAAVQTCSCLFCTVLFALNGVIGCVVTLEMVWRLLYVEVGPMFGHPPKIVVVAAHPRLAHRAHRRLQRCILECLQGHRSPNRPEGRRLVRFADTRIYLHLIASAIQSRLSANMNSVLRRLVSNSLDPHTHSSYIRVSLFRAMSIGGWRKAPEPRV